MLLIVPFSEDSVGHTLKYQSMDWKVAKGGGICNYGIYKAYAEMTFPYLASRIIETIPGIKGKAAKVREYFIVKVIICKSYLVSFESHRGKS